MSKPESSRPGSRDKSPKRLAGEAPSKRATAKSTRRDGQRILELKAANQLLRQQMQECRQALKVVKESEAQFRATTEDLLTGVYMFSGGRMLYVNPAMARIFGYKRSEIIGDMDPFMLVHPDDRALAAEQIRRRMQGEVKWAQYRFRGLRKDGTIIHCEALGRYRTYQGKPVIVGNILDITDQMRAEDALRKSEESLRKLRTEAERRLEAERTRIARELHDGLGQVLTALNMNLAWIGKRAADGQASIETRVDESISYVGQMTTIIRSLCKSLHPVVLDHHGLVEAIRSHVAEFGRYSQIGCELTIHPDEMDLPSPIAIAVFRIIQEALTNVARHSQASRCRVSLRLQGKFLMLTVRDNGIGSTSLRLLGNHSLGILGMKERSAALGGTFHIENARRGGVSASVRIPLAR